MTDQSKSASPSEPRVPFPGSYIHKEDVEELHARVEEPRSNEKRFAIRLANKILDRISGDPDDDLAVLSRQFLRALEREEPRRDEREAFEEWVSTKPELLLWADRNSLAYEAWQARASAAPLPAKDHCIGCGREGGLVICAACFNEPSAVSEGEKNGV